MKSGRGRTERRTTESVKEKERGERVEVRTTKRKNKDKRNVRIVFWNIAGMKKKDRDFWDYVEGFDVIGLCETWIEERDWKNIESKLSNDFVWRCQYASRARKKGRAKGGLVTGIRKGIEEMGAEDRIEIDGVQERKVRLDGQLWRILTVYNNGSIKDKRKEIESLVEELEEERLCIGGDFNARIGEGGKRIEGGEEEEVRRNTKDKETNNEGRELLSLVEGRGWDIVNENVRGDEGREWTYTGGRGKSVVDYVIVNQEAWSKIEKMEMKQSKIGPPTTGDRDRD